MKTFALLSGGKDSFLACTIALEQGFDVDLSVTAKAREYSMMFHFPNVSLAGTVSALLDIPNIMVEEDEVERIFAELAHKGYQAIVAGAIASEFQKTRLEELCTANGLACFAPLWRKNPVKILQELINRGIRSIVVSVSAEGLGPEDLGRPIDKDFISYIENKEKKYGLNPAGEGGEYESIVIGYESKTIDIEESEVKWLGSGGYLRINKARLTSTNPESTA
ncbi:MAG: diphthine--ammonia ligase [Thermoplasmataceae archaeon]